MSATNPAKRGARQKDKATKTVPPSVHATPLTFDEPGYLVTSPCGRQWFVPMTAVAEDYAEFRKQVDKLSAEEAAQEAIAQADFLPTWFYEQFSEWVDIERCGRLVTSSTKFKTKRALDRYRGDYFRTGEVQEFHLPRQTT